jgi:tetratricopeptide (TPR) repeat protein
MVFMSRSRFLRVGLIGLALLATPFAAFAVYRWTRTRSQPLPPGINRELYNAAADAFEQHYQRKPDHHDVLSWLGETLAEEDRLPAAIVCLEGIPSDHPKYGHLARFQQAYHFANLNRARQSEAKIREFLDLERVSPQLTRRHYVDALRLLRFILETQLRFEERQEIFREIHELDAAETFDTMAYCFPSLLRWNGPEATVWHEKFWKEDPDDFLLRVAAGRYRMGQGELDEARSLLEACCRQRPDSLWAHAAYLDVLREQGGWETIRRVLERLPPPSDREPWLLMRMRGHFHNHFQQYDEAVRCFQTALEADPASAESYQGLGRAYAGLQRMEERKQALEKSSVLARIQNRLGGVLFHDKEVEPMIEVADLSLQIGLKEFAGRIAHLIQKIDPNHPGGQELLERLDAEQRS